MEIMKVFTDETIHLSSSVITIGTFDGVHRGHQAVINETIKQSRLAGVPSILYTFNPPPRHYFQNVQILTKPEEKIERIKRLGVDYLIMVDFDEQYLNKEAEEFIEDLSLMNPKKIIVGSDFRFGKGRRGDISLLQKSYHVMSINPVSCENGERISSTRIRELIKNGGENQLDQLLGTL